MDLEEISRKAEIERKIEDNQERWTRREGDNRGKGIRFYQHDAVKRYAAQALLGIATIAICGYIGYKIANSGVQIIERWTDSLSAFYLEE